MLPLHFSKLHGAGNDFILIDNRNENIHLDKNQISFLCDRHLGIGADGLMELLNSDDYAFKMKYFNSDGAEGSMCGNGGRCISAFANHLGIFDKTSNFEAIDGIHCCTIHSVLNGEFDITIGLNDVETILKKDNDYFLNTGSPHFVRFVSDLDKYDVENEGRNLRWENQFSTKNGTNVNFVEAVGDVLYVRTFERGVEAETLSCGTGVTASAIAFCENIAMQHQEFVEIITRGGNLKVNFKREHNKYTNISLRGPVKIVFDGIINI